MPPGFLSGYFQPESDIVLVSKLRETMRSSPQSSQLVLRHHLLSGLADQRVGRYANFHENLIYARGYDHEDTLRLALM